MKKAVSILVCILLVFSIIGCGNTDKALQGDFYFDASQKETHETKLTEGEYTLIITATAQKGKVILPSNENVQNVINDELSKRYHNYFAWITEQEQEAQDFVMDMAFGEYLQKGGTFNFEQTIVGSNCAENLLSVIYEEYSYTMGAHGNTSRFALSFSLEDGHLLNSAELFENGWKENIAELINEQILLRSDILPEMLFENYRDYLKQVSMDRIYFARDGLHVIYDTYVLAPYAAGILEFTLSYDQLDGILKDKWVPKFAQGRYESAAVYINAVEELQEFDGRNALAISLDEKGKEVVIYTEGKVKNPSLNGGVLVSTDIPTYDPTTGVIAAQKVMTEKGFQLVTCYKKNLWFQADIMTAENPWVIKADVLEENPTLLFSYDTESGRKHLMITYDSVTEKLGWKETTLSER